jgi:hypothetical protein
MRPNWLNLPAFIVIIGANASNESKDKHWRSKAHSISGTNSRVAISGRSTKTEIEIALK